MSGIEYTPVSKKKTPTVHIAETPESGGIGMLFIL